MEIRKLITGVIYCYTNKINGKKYIGQTTDERKRKYRFKHSQQYGGLKINNARNKYGTSDNWTYKVLIRKQYINEEDVSFDLDLLEMFYIDKFDSFNNGYNSTYGGDGSKGLILSEETKKKIKNAMMGEKNPFWGRTHTEEAKEKNRIAHIGKTNSTETRLKISKSNKGKTMSDEARAKASETRKIKYPKGETHYNYGRKMTEEQKQKISKSKIGKRRKDLEQKIIQIDLQTGEIIKEWDSIIQAAKTLNLNSPNIINVCKGKYKQSGGFKWRYKESI